MTLPRLACQWSELILTGPDLLWRQLFCIHPVHSHLYVCLAFAIFGSRGEGNYEKSTAVSINDSDVIEDLRLTAATMSSYATVWFAYRICLRHCLVDDKFKVKQKMEGSARENVCPNVGYIPVNNSDVTCDWGPEVDGRYDEQLCYSMICLSHLLKTLPSRRLQSQTKDGRIC